MIEERRWGRWYLDTTKPASLNIAFKPWYIYDIPLYRCQTERKRELWIEHMAEKRRELISKRDIADLRQAFADLVAAGILPANDGRKLTLHQVEAGGIK